MANLALLYSPASDAASYSGGSWLAGMPLANLVGGQRTKVARTANLSTNATKFLLTHVDVNQRFSLFALIGHNLTVGATVRFRVANNSSGTSPSLDQTVTVTAATGDIVLYRQAAYVTGRFLLVDINDTSNPAGYVQLGRFMAGHPFSPSINMDFGASWGWTDPSTQSRSRGGQLWSDRRPKYRTLRVALGALTRAEAYDGDAPGTSGVHDMMEAIGVSGNLLAIYDPDDTGIVLARRMIYGRLASLDPIVDANPTAYPHTWSAEIEELL